MWSILITACFITSTKSVTLNRRQNETGSIFRNEQIVFSSNYNITKLLVPVAGKYIPSNDIPTIFFTVDDPKLDGGSCIYVLQGLTAFEILEGGRDTTSDYGDDSAIYFGGKDGLYKYNSDSFSAKKFGVFQDDIIQLQKLNGSDSIYALLADHKMYSYESKGTIKTRIDTVTCAWDFVIDTSNNLYFIDCFDRMPHIVSSNGKISSLLPVSLTDNFKEIKLLRPAFIMDNSIPLFCDGVLYILYSNGTSEEKDFLLSKRPSAYSVDSALYLVAALDGSIYEFNVMEVLMKLVVGLNTEWPNDFTKIVSVMMEVKNDTFPFDRLLSKKLPDW